MSAQGLWQYAETLYAQHGVAASLLGLQHRHGADVDLLLWCCWCAASGRGAIDEAALGAADGAVAAWREHVTRPLRTVRDIIGKHGPLSALAGAERVRRQVLDAELGSERVALGVLEDLAPVPAVAVGGEACLAADSLAGYCRLLGLRLEADDEAALLTLLTAAFGTGQEQGLRAALRVGPATPEGD